MSAAADAGVARWASPVFADVLAPLLAATRVTIESCERLAGGAIQQNFVLVLDVHDGPWAALTRIVLRTGAPTNVAASRPRDEEHTLLVAAAAAGVAVPRPIALYRGDAHWPAFMLMTHVVGDTAGRVLTRASAAPRVRLVEAIGANLARVHAIAATHPSLAFLGEPPLRPTIDLINGYRTTIEHWRTVTGDARPVLAWTLRWLERQLPPLEPVVLVHRDYRVGNLIVDADRLAATLDWEFAGWGNPLEDLGWFCAPCWRFARPDLAAGGLADIDDLLRGYNAAAGSAHVAADLRYWQVLAQLRWAVIALQQALRFIEGGERSLELALTGRMLPELEWQMLELTGDTLA